jgi:hypothetical protein
MQAWLDLDRVDMTERGDLVAKLALAIPHRSEVVTEV